MIYNENNNTFTIYEEITQENEKPMLPWLYQLWPNDRSLLFTREKRFVLMSHGDSLDCYNEYPDFDWEGNPYKLFDVKDEITKFTISPNNLVAFAFKYIDEVPYLCKFTLE